MTLRATLAAPLEQEYVAAKGPQQPAQVALRQGRAELARTLPPGLLVRVSGAAVNLPHLPWLAVLDRDVTTTAQDGLYVCYLFTRDLQRVYLSMNQGVTAHREARRKDEHPRPGVRALQDLRWESTELRDALGPLVSHLRSEIELGGSGFYADGYEAGNVAARRYDTAKLPSEASLRADLDEFLAIYRACVSVRDRLVLARPDHFHVSTVRTATASPVSAGAAAPHFRPRDASDYLAQVPAQVQRKTRKHEELLSRFVTSARAAGWTCANNVHPRDLVLTAAGVEYLVEAKTVGNNAEQAVREAIGQLFSYRHFLYRSIGQPDPRLLALFSEPVGGAFLALLQDLGIACTWWQDGAWCSTDGAPALLA